MKLNEKKLDMAGKFYCMANDKESFSGKYRQASKGGLGKDSKYAMSGRGKGESMFKYTKIGEGHSPEPKYSQAGGTVTRKVSKTSPKGKNGARSLKSTGDNFGETMMLGKDNHNRP